MTKNKQKERESAIAWMCECYAFRLNGCWLTSFWDLAGNLNNCWYARLFVNKKHAERIHANGEFAIPYYHLYFFRRGIDRTIRGMKDARKIMQDGREFYSIKIRKPASLSSGKEGKKK